jgi:hypothetical protein
MSFESAGEFFEDLVQYCKYEMAALESDLTELYVDLQVKLLERIRNLIRNQQNYHT